MKAGPVGRSAALLLATSVVLGGCYPYRLSGDDVVPTDRRLAASGYRISAGVDLADAGRRLGLAVTEETIAAPFGAVALTRFEHAQRRPLIVFCGGNMFRREVSGQKIVQLLAPLGDVWIFDYPGYGDSSGDGRPREFEEMNAAIAARVDRAFGEGRTGDLAFWGHSLGGTVCGDLAGRSATPSDVVLVATFQSFDQVVRAGAAARAGPLGRLVRPVIADDVPGFDIARALDGYDGTAIVVGARNDATVPWEASSRLERALRRQGVATQLIVLASGDHSLMHEEPGLVARIGQALRDAEFGD
ncbi:alpha/beta hydrolase family protein [Brevundimonas sp.]|uniref:alpha/beta hydrolase family protein n=1 Tax=Brevundimonas sp. TaxID=1871086 RepID=UPI002BAB2783|nr:alpha/beta fold hydrolase [Brevundimonas sp.]HWQ85282.1 alpha/beta fold hydrolase [Brevundimonas sp.]